MKIAFVTNLRAPYRTLQLNEYSKIKNISLMAYYTDKINENRDWNLNNAIGFSEIDLNGYRIFKKYGYLNLGLIRIIKENDLIILGCYEQPTYIILSILCRIFRKPYILSFDGISTNRLKGNEGFIKKILKKIVIGKAQYIMGNGTVSKRYFNEIFNYPNERIYNQFLTVDSETINKLYKKKNVIRKKLRNYDNIDDNCKVLIYSGRLVDIKNVQSVIRAVSKINDEKIILFIVGGGELEDYLQELSKLLDVNIKITGFIKEQKDVFKHYFLADAFILPSIYEPWGLVVNEAMISGLPILVSNICGCSMDLVVNGKNGFSFDPYDLDDMSKKICEVLNNNKKNIMGMESRNIIKEWTYQNSRVNLNKIINKLKKDK